MGSESSGVVGFDLGPLLHGQTSITKLKSALIRLLLVLEVWDCKPTCMKLDLTLSLSFKVKRG